MVTEEDLERTKEEADMFQKIRNTKKEYIITLPSGAIIILKGSDFE